MRLSNRVGPRVTSMITLRSEPLDREEGGGVICGDGFEDDMDPTLLGLS